MRALLLLLGLSLPLFGCAAAHRGGERLPPSEERLRAMERQVYELVNTYRVQHGLRALAYHPHLAAVARMHSQAMAAGEKPFGHEGLEERLSQVGQRVPVLELGENLFAGQPVSMVAGWRAVTGWLKSPPHRHTIEEGCYELTGIGAVADSSGRVFFTQLFARRLLPPPSSESRTCGPVRTRPAPG